MTDPDAGSSRPEPRVSHEEAAEILGVPFDRIAVLIDEGLLTPLDDDPDRLAGAEVEALRLLGG